MILRKLTTAALAWPLVRHLFHFVRKYVAGQKCGSCPPFLLQTLNIKPRHTLLEPELYSWQQAISPAIKSLPHSGHAVEPIGTDTMQNQQIIVVVLGSTLKGIVAVKPNVCMECAGVTLMHGCSTTEAFLDLVAMVRVGLSEAMCSIQHEIDVAWKHTALRIE